MLTGFVLWDDVAGPISSIQSYQVDESWLQCVYDEDAGAGLTWSMENGVVTGLRNASVDPLDRIASASFINARRAELEIKPVKIGQHWYDFDLTSRSRFEGSIAAWNELIEADTNAMLFTAEGEIRWRTADNQFVPFDQADFVLLYNSLIKAAATRASQLYVKSLLLKASSATTLRDCAIQNWPIELMP